MCLVSFLQGQGINPPQLKQALLNVETILTPGLLTALVPILPSKKEVALCADVPVPEIDNIADLSDREIAQLFILELSSIARLNERVEVLLTRCYFDLKLSALRKVILFFRIFVVLSRYTLRC